LATTIYMQDDDARTSHRGRNDAKLNGTASGWNCYRCSTSRGSTATNVTVTSVAGPTNGVEVGFASGPIEWLSPPLAAGVTISGSITFNIRAKHAGTDANAAPRVVIERVDKTGAIVSTVISDAITTVELTGSEAAYNWSNTPTSTTFAEGDRIRIRVAFDDSFGGAQAQVTGQTLTFYFSGPTAAATGDSYVTFTETLTFYDSNPSGTLWYLADSVSDIVDQGASNDEKALVSAVGSSTVTAVRNTATGFTSPLQWTKTAGGNTVEWYSPQLAAFTLSDFVRVGLYMLESNASANAGVNVEVAVVNNDGSGATVYGSGGPNNGVFRGDGELPTASGLRDHFICGPALAVTAGQRIRIRVRLDDSGAALVTAFTATINYAGAAGTADSSVRLTQTASLYQGSMVVPRRDPLALGSR